MLNVFVNRSQVTTLTQTSLLTHIFALCLRVDNYSTDTSLIAADLQMAVRKYVAVPLTRGTPNRSTSVSTSSLRLSVGIFSAVAR